jgi:penicillin amidase
VTIRRNRWGIPHISAENGPDAWFGLGFCHAQDRAFQLESLLRVTRGTLAALVGPEGLAVDRLARRIGFHRSAEAQLAALGTDERGTLEAYARGVNAGLSRGLRRRPHELVLLRARPTAWTAADVLGFTKLQGLLLATNWDLELARLKILQADGPEALRALDPAYPEWLPVSTPPGAPAGPAIDRLLADLEAFTAVVGTGGGSNNWALAASRTATGRPLLANDPHLAPSLPAHWYLAHLQTPDWAVAGATFVGGPAVVAGHNGFASWGLTAGLADNTDLYLEEVGPDGRSVRAGEGFVPCEVRVERIEMRGGPPVIEEVLITPHGPLIGPALAEDPGAVAFRALWLDPLPVEGYLRLNQVRSFAEFREAFARWPVLSLNLAYADAGGTIGWQLVGQVPRRRKGWGILPARGADPAGGWEETPVQFFEMPWLADPPAGFLATANNQPVAEGGGPFLGVDWIDGYRLARISEALAEREDWDVQQCQALQMDVLSIPWREIRETVLAAPAAPAGAALALGLLRAWDGRVAADSAAATVFELFLAELIARAAAAKAPRSAAWALGRGFTALTPATLFGVRRAGHLVRLLREQPAGWFARTWPEEISDALAAAVERLRARFGPEPAAWTWGEVRPLTLRHPLGRRKPLDRVFDLGPIPWGGDANTAAQAATGLLDPLTNPGVVAGLRMVIDVGAWDESRFAIAGGQSGNPFSPHYADQLPLWARGEGVPIPWSEDAVARATRSTLRLIPLPPGSGKG